MSCPDDNLRADDDPSEVDAELHREESQARERESEADRRTRWDTDREVDRNFLFNEVADLRKEIYQLRAELSHHLVPLADLTVELLRERYLRPHGES